MSEFDYPGSRADGVVWKIAVFLFFGLLIVGWKLGWWAGKKAWRYRPVTATLATLALLWWRLGTIGLAVVAGVVALVLVVARVRYPAGFNRWVREPYQFARRRRFYRQGW